MTTPPSDQELHLASLRADWRAHWSQFSRVDRRHPPQKSLVLAIVLFLLTLGTCLAAGTQFARAFAQDQAASTEEFTRAFTLFYKNPAALVEGLPFALTLLAILLAHELGHYFACRHHHIHSSYPFFIPFPSLIGTFGAFILIRSPIRTTRALFDVGASGPLVGFAFAIPALIYGVLHAKIVPGIAHSESAEFIFGSPLIVRLVSALLHPGVSSSFLLLHPVGRAAWVGLFATSLNLLPTAQLDGGHIVRSLNPNLHRYLTLLVPFALLPLGRFFWPSWYIWAALLFGIRFLRIAPVHDPVPLDPRRRFAAFLCLIVFLLSFMLAPISGM
ncbi:MAG TPA: site-2 protease family protein [Candidatus Saccharimonadales bacterium]|nr:site-2 protease family protein [Candidatus Saccharimonadales bacterium]